MNKCNVIQLALALSVCCTAAMAAPGEKLKQFAPMSSFSPEQAKQNTDEMAKLSEQVNKVFKSSGYGSDDCHTVCTTTITYVNGQAVPSVSCSLQCGF